MSFWETLAAIVAAQIPLFLINRYVFDKIVKKGLEKVERHSLNYIKGLWRKKEE